MRVQLNKPSKFGADNGSVVEVERIDVDGDAVLSGGYNEEYDSTYAFKGEYILVSSDTPLGHPVEEEESVTEEETKPQFTLTIPLDTLLDVAEVLDRLPESVVQSSTLVNN